MQANPCDWTNEIIGAAIEVHRQIGPGLLESVYEECLCRELESRGIPFVRQAAFALRYKGVPVEGTLRVDLLVADSVVVEIKSLERVLPVHEAQVLTYLKATGRKVGLLLNFNVARMADGLQRFVM